jgi:hypothetical protein
MVDDEEAIAARSLWASCLKMLAGLAHESPDPEVREFAERELRDGLVKVRRFIATPGISSEARAQAEAALRSFWQA